jgi:sulfur carrier protein ThiS
MYINIKLYGDMKRYAPGDQNEFELLIGPGATFQDILKQFSIQGKGYVCLVNGRRIDQAYIFNDKDTLVLFPEISGG